MHTLKTKLFLISLLEMFAIWFPVDLIDRQSCTVVHRNRNGNMYLSLEYAYL